MKVVRWKMGFVTKWYHSRFTTLGPDGLAYIQVCVDFARIYLFENKTLCLSIGMGVMKKYIVGKF